MTQKTFTVEVTQTVEVTLDPAKFDEKFLSEFREGFYSFQTIEEHAEHIAQMEARGLTEIQVFPHAFLEGYGEASSMGIAVKSGPAETQVSA